MATSEITAQELLAPVLAAAERAVEFYERHGRRPVLDVLTFGPGHPLAQTLGGDARATYAGLAIANASGRVIKFATSRTSKPSGAMHCPAHSMIVWPVQFAELTLAIDAAEGEAEDVAVLRMWTPPPAPAVYAYA